MEGVEGRGMYVGIKKESGTSEWKYNMFSIPKNDGIDGSFSWLNR